MSIHSRAHAETVCQPLAISPPNGESKAASGSVWKYWGSKRRPKSMISDSVISYVPSSMTSPGVKSSKNSSGSRIGVFLSAGLCR